MSDDKVSIIIPVYNVEKYIKDCLNSVILQTYNNIEIIVIDDGSTDRSYTICEEFLNQTDKLKIYSTQNNGVSMARNLGIKIATGKYIVFLDSDDLIEKNMIEKLVENMKKYNVDMVACNYFYMYKDKNILAKFPENMLISNEQCKIEIFKNTSIRGFSVNKIFKRDIIESANLKFQKDIKICEDLLFVFEYLLYSKSIFILNEPLYFYRMRKTSSLHSSLSNELSVFDAINQIIKIEPDLYSKMSELYFYLYFKYYHSLKKYNLLNTVKKVTIKEMLFCKDMTLKEKMICLVYIFVPSKLLIILKNLKNKANYFN